jgi:hypothetical protein
MNTNNQTLNLKTNLPNAREVCALIKGLSEKFRIHYRKGESVDLVYSQAGDLKNPSHNLAIWFNETNIKEVNFIKELLLKTN